MRRFAISALAILVAAACEDAAGPKDTASLTRGLTAHLGIGATDPLTPSADTYLREGAPNQNQGTETSLRLQNSGNNRALLMWDPTVISQAIGAGTLTAARIELTISDNGDNWGTSGRTIDLHRMSQAWTESGATWNCAEDANLINHRPDCAGATSWEMGNPESAHPWVPTPTATQTIHSGQSGVVTFDVTADVADIVTGGGAQHGWILKKTNEGANGRVEFGSRESASGPRLVLTVHTGSAVAFTAVSGGAEHTCGLTAAGAAYCWGFNGYGGALGDGTTTDRLNPVLVAGGVSFAAVRAGDYHTCGLMAAGAAYCWGSNAFGQLGDGTTTDHSSPGLVAGGVSFAAVSASSYHTCGLTAVGAVYCWGYNGLGELGDETTTDRSSPVLVAGGVSFAAVSVGAFHTCGVTAAGAAYCWGGNFYGALGDGSTTDRSSPVLVAGGASFAAVSAGAFHTCGVTATGAAYCWGFNGNGQLGDGTTTDRSSPVLVAGDVSLAAVDAGSSHTCGVTAAGAAHCWGHNWGGQLGDGTTTDRSSPVLVAGGLSFAAVDAGGSHTCGVTAAGAAYCWGLNAFGQIGDGTTTDRLSPVRVVE